MMERIHNNRQALILGVAVLFLLLLVPYMLMIRPQTEDIETQKSEVARLQQENEIFQRKIDELKGEGVGELSDEEIAQKLPATPNQEQIVTDLYKVGLATNVILSDATFASENPTSGSATAQTTETTTGQVNSVYVTANIQGDYASIKNWMTAMQNLPRFTSIEQFTLNKPYVFGSSLLDATVTFTASYLPRDASDAVTADTTAGGDAATPSDNGATSEATDPASDTTP
ncbi:type II secretion system protein GspM [Saccharibacillus sacchari]|uniref:Type II secretion system protein GspM n=1 Tax=Saccharibacillus sacchari TaxID=456493 RepID=A0ACC6P9K2_9BACL